jgi:hypothetical protein
LSRRRSGLEEKIPKIMLSRGKGLRVRKGKERRERRRNEITKKEG